MLLTNIFVFLNALVIFVFLFFRKNNVPPNRLLAFIFLIPSLYFLNSSLVLSGLIHQVPWVFFLVQTIAPVFHVLVYLYVQFFLGKRIKLNIYLTILSVLLFAGIVLISVRFLLSDKVVRDEYMYALVSNNYPSDILVYTIMYYVVLMIYLMVLATQVFRFKKAIENSVSNFDTAHFMYITRFVALLFLLNFTLIIFYLTLPVFYVEYLVLPLAVLVIYLFVFYFSFQYNAIFTRYSFIRFYQDGIITQKELLPEVVEERKTSGISEKHQEIIELLEHAFEKERIYTNPNLSLKLLSQKLKAPSYLVSQAINLKYNKSFFDLVNEKRVQEAQRRLKTLPKNQTIESVAFEVGFNSRASFYRAFKKHTGETPKEIFGMSQILN